MLTRCSTSQLAPGRLEVLHPDGSKTEVVEKDVVVVDKGFLRGDIIRKRATTSAASSRKQQQAGQIVDLKTEVQLQRVLDGEVLPGWHDTASLRAAGRIARADHVVEPTSGWVGVVEEVFEMAMIEVSDGVVRRVCDTGTRLSVGNSTEAIREMLEERGESVLAHFIASADLKQVRSLPLSASLHPPLARPLALSKRTDPLRARSCRSSTSSSA